MRKRPPTRFHFDRRIPQILKTLQGGKPDDLFCTKQVAEIFGVSPQWVEIARCGEFGPEPEPKNGSRLVWYSRANLIKFCHERLRGLSERRR